MEGYIILILLLIGAPIALAIWLIVRAVGARQSIDELRRRLGSLELEVIRLKKEREPTPRRRHLSPPEVPGAAVAAAAEPVPRRRCGCCGATRAAANRP